jgi:hydroxyacylglutathione hydrolase
VRITHVCETHIHNDFLSGSRGLAAVNGASLVASADALLQFDHQPVRDGDTLEIGEIKLTVLATPASGLAHQLYRTLHEHILPLGDDVVVYPTHGAGSFCTAAAGEGSSTTIGRERLSNALLRLPTPDLFADRLLASMPGYRTISTACER